MLSQPQPGEATQPTLLAVVHGASRGSEAVVGAGFDLDEDNTLRRGHDEIDLPCRATPVTGEHVVSRPAVPPLRLCLTPAPTRLTG